MNTEDRDVTAMLTCAHAIVGAVTDVAEWLQPEAVTATSMTLMETVHGIIIAAAAKAVKDPEKSLDQIIEKASRHTAEMARYFHEQLAAKEQP